MYKYFFKRFFDFWISLVVLICISPVLLVVTVWLHFANKGAGAFFLQPRPGKKRLTRVGHFVRSTSLDEFPQFINVLKGDMALIGPRPLLVDFLPLYSPKQARRHDVRPGITGWAQVNGRNTCKYSQKFKYDVWYVDHLSMLLDLKIIFMTIKNVLGREDIGEDQYDETDDLGWNQYINKKA